MKSSGWSLIIVAILTAAPTMGRAVTEIIDSTGDGAGNQLIDTIAVAVDGSGNVYVTGGISDNAFKITPGGPHWRLASSQQS